MGHRQHRQHQHGLVQLGRRQHRPAQLRRRQHRRPQPGQLQHRLGKRRQYKHRRFHLRQLHQRLLVEWRLPGADRHPAVGHPGDPGLRKLHPEPVVWLLQLRRWQRIGLLQLRSQSFGLPQRWRGGVGHVEPRQHLVGLVQHESPLNPAAAAHDSGVANVGAHIWGY
nr:hypothetical protein [Mycobacterium lacus]